MSKMTVFHVCGRMNGDRNTMFIKSTWGNSLDAYNHLEEGEMVVVHYNAVEVDDTPRCECCGETAGYCNNGN